jgi:hypothetical protein
MALLDGLRVRTRTAVSIPFLIAVALATAGPQSSPVDGQSPTAPSELDSAALLADSAIRYESSGGIAGFFSGASFVAKDGVVSVEYRPPFGRATAEPRRATIAPDTYLALWKEIIDGGVPSLPSTGEPDARGADRIRNSFEVRRGATATTLVWMDTEPPARPPDLSTLVENVISTARKAADEPRP